MSTTFRNLLYISIIFIFWLSSQTVFGQEIESISADSTKKDFVESEAIYTKKKPLKSINFNGYYRFFGYGRHIRVPYPNLNPYEKAYGVGDVYREPMLSLYMTGRAGGKTTFGTELFFFTPYLGTNLGNAFTMNLGINLYGNFATSVGNFGIRAGGIHWHTLSPFTMGTFQAFDRFSIFDRTPWEGVLNTDKYDNYYDTGSINRDNRWGKLAFQGIILEASNLPKDFYVSALFGKTQNNGGLGFSVNQAGQTVNLPPQTNPLSTVPNGNNAGNFPLYNGFAGTSRILPSFVVGGQIKKNFNENYIGYNTLNSWTFLDSLSATKRFYQVHTLDFDWKVKGLRLTGELGAGSFESPEIARKWGEALMMKIYIPKEYTFLPFSVQFYQIGQSFYNLNGEVQTFSNPEIQTSVAGSSQNGQASVGGALTQVEQLAHNRRGININTEYELGPLKVNAGLGIAKEIDLAGPELSYVHRINGLALSRVYNPFPENATGPTVVGPYGRVFTYFRGAYEKVVRTDVNPLTGEPLSKAYFNAIDLQVKFKHDIAKRPFYLFYLGSWQSARNVFSPVPYFNWENSYLFAQYHEVDLYYELFPKFILAGYFGLESIKGGKDTEWDIDTFLPRDQLGIGYAIGFDWLVAKNAGIYARQRWMRFQDRNFALDEYRGTETTIELKIFF